MVLCYGTLLNFTEPPKLLSPSMESQFATTHTNTVYSLDLYTVLTKPTVGHDSKEKLKKPYKNTDLENSFCRAKVELL